jgi:energy-coupling factor transport system permease protein
MLITVISWFSCAGSVLTSDKFIYLFGRVIPALSLILAMALRFVPRFIAQTKVISKAQECVGRGMSGGNPFQKMKRGVKILSIMVTWALENAIDTADSMKGRGYGLPERSAFSIFRMDKRDAYAMVYITLCSTAVLAGAVTGAYQFRYNPTVEGEWTGAATIAVFAAYCALGAFPLAKNLKEDIVWKSIESKT